LPSVRFFIDVYITGIVETKPMTSQVGDIRVMSDVDKALDGVDVVIHTAGLVSFGTLPDVTGMEQVNVKGEGRRNKVRFLVRITKPAVSRFEIRSASEK
jgi:hypothetical protein